MTSFQVNTWPRPLSLTKVGPVSCGGRREVRTISGGCAEEAHLVPDTHHPDSISGLALYTTASIFSGREHSLRGAGADELKQSVPACAYKDPCLVFQGLEEEMVSIRQNTAVGVVWSHNLMWSMSSPMMTSFSSFC